MGMCPCPKFVYLRLEIAMGQGQIVACGAPQRGDGFLSEKHELIEIQMHEQMSMRLRSD